MRVVRVLILPPVVSGVIFGVSCPACQHLNGAKRTKEVLSSYWLGMAATALQSYHTPPWNTTQAFRPNTSPGLEPRHQH